MPRIAEMLRKYGLKEYVIAKIVSAPDAKPDFFGMVQIWFDTLENARKGMEYTLPRATDAFLERITDTRRIFVVEEKEMKV